MTWPGDQLERIGVSEELQITEVRSDETRWQWTPIWVVRVGENLYVRAAYGRTAAWYRHVTEANSARIRAGGIETDVSITRINDQALIDQVDAAYRAKYGDQPSWLTLFLTTLASEATLRLDRAEAA